MRKLVASLACRARGSRLYGKPLQRLDVDRGVTVLDHMIDLLTTEAAIGEIVLAVAVGAENEPFHELAAQHRLQSVQGDEKDVLGRHLVSAERTGATDIFIVTTESPFTYFEAIANAWRIHCDDGNDVTATDNLPDGSAFGIFSVNTLRRSHEEGEDRHRSEYISLFVRDHIDQFRVRVVDSPTAVQRPDIRLTIDYPEDLVLCRRVYDHFRELAPRIPVGRIIELLDSRPDINDIVKPYTVPSTLYSA
jgi:spore coat polysaccharide biosynthesis protein SpsF